MPKLFISEIPEFSRESIRASLPELPWERRVRYAQTYALKESDIAYLCTTLERANFFDAVAKELSSNASLLPIAANYIVSDLAGIYAKKGDEKEFEKLDSAAFAKLIKLVGDNSLSSRGAKDTLFILVEKNGDPETIAKENNLIQIHDSGALTTAVDKVLDREERAVLEYKNGKQSALQYLIGKAMKESGGAGNPESLRKLIEEKLS